MEDEGISFQVESLEDEVGGALHRLYVDEAGNEACSALNFHKAAFDDLGGTQSSPQRAG